MTAWDITDLIVHKVQQATKGSFAHVVNCDMYDSVRFTGPHITDYVGQYWAGGELKSIINDTYIKPEDYAEFIANELIQQIEQQSQVFA